MTTTSAQPPRDRSALGRGVSTLIPQSAVLSPAEHAAAALAAIRTVPVHVGVLQAAIHLLEEKSQTTDDPISKATVDATVALLREAVERQQPHAG
ncbi:hypothetical protein GCM10010232_68100 [Streptomyces amakusaensis]|uniref:Uncharacterized protein n=1 Tax=Streptomyces amakusaensis TaxID=67271 RepID=A0ABW0AVD1_9ACTN